MSYLHGDGRDVADGHGEADWDDAKLALAARVLPAVLSLACEEYPDGEGHAQDEHQHPIVHCCKLHHGKQDLVRSRPKSSDSLR